MKKVIINGQALNEVEISQNTCGSYDVHCTFMTDSGGCDHPGFRGSRLNLTHCNNPPRIFLHDDQVLEYIAGRLKHGG